MMGKSLKSLNLDRYKNQYEFVLYDQNIQKVYGDISPNIAIQNGIYLYNNTLIDISSNTYNHLGIAYILVQDSSFGAFVSSDKFKIITIFVILSAVFIALGIFLGFGFIRPIQDQRFKTDKFIKDTTHELNTPISALLLASDMDMSSQNIARIKLSAKRVAQIYQNLSFVSFGNLKNHKIKYENVHILLMEELEYFEILAQKKSINLNLKIKPTKLKIDKEDFKRLTNNLISNAIKYTSPNKNIQITLDQQYFEICDEGIGIKLSKQKEIFTRYSRIKGSEGGFGVGLDIVYNITQRYNYQLKLDSVLGQGTTVKILF
jgi:two-component system OmpR family sensor kinase